MIDLTQEEIQQRLTQAREAYHQLMIGGSVAEVRDQNGETVRYTQTSITRLRSYISELERLLNGTTDGPLRVYL